MLVTAALDIEQRIAAIDRQLVEESKALRLVHVRSSRQVVLTEVDRLLDRRNRLARTRARASVS